MTNEKAIEILEECWRYSRTYKYTDAEIREAIDKAIKALEQEHCKDKISKIKYDHLVRDEYGNTDKELVDTVNMLVDRVNELVEDTTNDRLKKN